MVADRRHISENNKPISIMSNQLRIITINDMDFGGKIHEDNRQNSRFTEKEKRSITNHRENKGFQFTVHEENRTQFTNHRENKERSIHGSRRK